MLQHVNAGRLKCRHGADSTRGAQAAGNSDLDGGRPFRVWVSPGKDHARTSCIAVPGRDLVPDDELARLLRSGIEVRGGLALPYGC